LYVWGGVYRPLFSPFSSVQKAIPETDKRIPDQFINPRGGGGVGGS